VKILFDAIVKKPGELIEEGKEKSKNLYNFPKTAVKK